MQTTSRNWLRRILLPCLAALTLSALAAGEPPRVFHGQLKVLDAQGQPLREVAVEGYRGPDWRNFGGPMRLELRAITDAQGAIALTTTNQGMLLLVARKPGLALGWNTWTTTWPPLDEEESALELTLTAPKAIAGSVQDEAGQPVADALVWVDRAYQPSSRRGGQASWSAMHSQLGRQLLSARSGADGQFRIEGLPAEATLSLTAAKAGLAPVEMANTVYSSGTLPYQAGQTNAVVVLGRAGSVEGQVVREDTGAPLTGAQVFVGAPSWFGGREPGVTDAQGRFRLPDLLPGNYKLHAAFGTQDFADWVCEPVAITVQAGVTTRGATLTASRGAVLKLIVRDQTTGQPIPKGSLWLARQDLNPQSPISDQGLAWLRLVPGDYHFGVVAHGYTRYDSQVTVERGQTNEVLVELEPATRLRGTVLDPAGKPAAKVRVFSLGGGGSGGESRTDAQGQFTTYLNSSFFAGVSQEPVLFIARDPARGLAASAEVEADVTNATLKLEPALTLVVQVLDPAGHAITNAGAQVMFKAAHSSASFGHSVRVNAAGQVELTGLPVGRPYGVIVTAPGFGREQREVEAPEPMSRRLELEPFHLPPANLQVAGLVVDEEDKPVPGASVNVNGDNQPYLHARTDAQGRFRFPHVCAGQLSLNASLPDGSRFGNMNAEAGETNVMIQLGTAHNVRPGAKLAKVTGTVVGPDGKPAPKVSVLLFSQGTERQADAEGRFKFSYDDNPFGSRQPAALIARDPAYNLAAVLDLDPEVTNVTLKLEPGLSLAGRVTTSKDQAITNAEVQLLFHIANMGSSLGKPVRTDAQGRFEFKGLPAGRRYELAVSAKGFGRENRTVEATDTQTNRLELVPFHLPVADRVIAGVVQDADDKPVPHITVSFYGDKQPNQSGQSDAKGRFRFEYVAAGEVHINANDAHGHFGSISAEAGDTNIVVQFGVNQFQGSARGLARVSGTVSDPEGKPAPRVALTLFPFHNTEKRSDASGHFKLAYDPGQWSSSPDMPHILIARDLARNLATCLPIEADATNADLKLEAGLTLAGRVVGAKGQALSNAEVLVMFRAERVSGSLGSQLRVGRDGQFEIKALPPGGRYSLEISAPGFGRESRAIEPKDNGTNQLDLGAIALPVADQRVAGVVLDADDKPAAGAWVNLYGDKQPSANTRTDSKGHFAFTNLAAGEVRLSANSFQGNFANLTAEVGDTNVTLVLGLSQAFGGSGKAARLTGAVVDAEGKPAPKVRVSLFPFQGTERQTDPEGHFKLLYYPETRGGSQDARVLIARDFTRNLATALEVDPDATNATLKLEPGFTLAGRITDPSGKPIAGAQVSVQFSSGRMSTQLGPAVLVDAQGRFEVKTLPPGCRYYLLATAKGYGQDSQNIEPNQADVPRLELEPLQLPVADRPLAGVVVDADDKPVPSAWVNVYGNKQPSQNTQTDAKGHFAFKQVCAGPIRLSANSQHGGAYANLEAEGGDTNLTVQLRNSSSARPAAPQQVNLKGKPLPDVTAVGLSAAEAPAGQPVLVALIDTEQRPSRHTLKLLSEQAPALKQKKVALLLIQAGAMSDDAFAAWKQEAALPFAVGRFPTNPAPARAAWGTGPLPRLLLTDATHRVIADGFPIEELETKLKGLEK